MKKRTMNEEVEKVVVLASEAEYILTPKMQLQLDPPSLNQSKSESSKGRKTSEARHFVLNL